MTAKKSLAALGEAMDGPVTPATKEAPAIRPGRPEDAAVLAPLAAQIFYETHLGFSLGEEFNAATKLYIQSALTEEQMARELADSDSAFFLAWAARGLAGYAKLNASYLAPGLVGEKPVALQRLYLDGAWHGQGLADRLMTTCLGEAEGRGFKTIWLQVHVKNERAIRFYKRWRFSVAGDCAFQMGATLNCNYFMARSIKAA